MDQTNVTVDGMDQKATVEALKNIGLFGFWFFFLKGIIWVVVFAFTLLIAIS